MDLKKELSELVPLLNKSKPAAGLHLISKITAVLSLLENPTVEVPPDIFECLDADLRRVALQALILFVLQAMDQPQS